MNYKTHMLDRRTFTAALGGALTRVPAARGAQRLNIGVGAFSYHSLSIDETIERLRKHDIREIEMSRGEFMPMKPPTPEMCSSARGKLDRAGLSGSVGATLDVGQIAACGHDAVEAVRLLAPHLKVVHLKDVEGAGAEHNVLLGTGVANIPGVMKELKRAGFTGLVAIEYEKEGAVDADMARQIEYARSLA